MLTFNPGDSGTMDFADLVLLGARNNYGLRDKHLFVGPGCVPVAYKLCNNRLPA